MAPGDQLLHAVVELDDLDERNRAALLDQLAPLLGRHVGPEHDQRLVGELRILLVGMDDVVDQVGAVAAAAGGDQNIVALRAGGPAVRSCDRLRCRKPTNFILARTAAGTSRPVSGS